MKKVSAKNVHRDKLAIHGGSPAMPAGLVKPWPPIGAIDRRLVLDSLNSPTHSFGPNCKAIEQEFAAWNGNRFCISTNSGTAALHMAVAACGVGAGDHVLVPAYSWSSSATCIIHHNAIPVFVDIDFDTMNLDVDKIEAAITPRTKAIVVVHLHGLAVNMAKVMAVARKHKLRVIEDACQAHGALFQGRKTGLWGDCAAFSLNQNKCLCAGEGGFFVTNQEDLYQAARQIWNFGESRTPVESRDYHVYGLGWMYRSNDLTAAFGRAQLSKLTANLKVTRANGLRLAEELAGTPGMIQPVEPRGHQHNWYNYIVRIDFDAFGYKGNQRRFRDAVIKALRAENTPANNYQYFILPEMTVFQARNAYGHGCPWSCQGGAAGKGVDYNPARFPVAKRHCDTHLVVGMALRPPNGDRVVKAVAKGYRKVFAALDSLDVDAILADKK